ncbi:hypothetical protein GCK72_001182 [Caenorhabditis remanei]|uniref:F-box domain-containing protein n=1 Tax=Caenorhabditis remanei TaxID=31234 RepID=A0A6A5HP19_CAERE|nr:hypothetical protein GCK72_001182 [Caenorhabditis remanei]KAF1769365.1 hypothetical protein GCK72_001182 [Caenorhabditis remanei]
MKKFNIPLLDLPPLVIQKSLQKLSVLDLFEFSAISPLPHRLVKSTPNLVLSGSTIDVQLSETTEVSVMSKKGRTLGCWTFNEDVVPKKVKKDSKYNKTVDGIEMKIVRKPFEKATVYTPSDLKYVPAVMNHLFDLFNTSFGEIVIDIQEKEISEVQCLIDVIKQCERLTLVSHRKQHSNEGILSVLNSIEVTKDLSFYVNPKPKFKLPEYLLRINALKFKYSNWITRKMLLSMDCETIRMENCTLKPEDMKAFVNQWLNSDNTKLQWLVMIIPDGYDPFDTKSFIIYRLFHDNTSDGMDFVRKDGVLATIIQRDCVFKFLVWHERFPKDDDDDV